MKNEVNSIFKLSCFYISTIVGAGFASGNEIIDFFTSFYEGGFYGIIVSGILFSLIGTLVLLIIKKYKVEGQGHLYRIIYGKHLGKALEKLILIFIFLILVVMVSGTGVLCTKLFQIPELWAVILCLLICMVVLKFDMKALLLIEVITTPMLIIGIMLIGTYIIFTDSVEVFNFIDPVESITDNWIFSALIYVSYNSIISIVFLSNTYKYIKTKSVAIYSGIISGAVLMILAVILNASFTEFYPKIGEFDIPMVYLVERINFNISIFYKSILLIAMMVTSISLSFCINKGLSTKYKGLVFNLLMILVVVLSTFGFSNLVSTIYPLIGYVGVFIISTIILRSIKLL